MTTDHDKATYAVLHAESKAELDHLWNTVPDVWTDDLIHLAFARLGHLGHLVTLDRAGKNALRALRKTARATISEARLLLKTDGLPRGYHVDFWARCSNDGQCNDPTCEGCLMTEYRRERVAELQDTVGACSGIINGCDVQLAKR